MKSFNEMAINESANLKSLKNILKEIKNVVKAVEDEATLSDKKNTSEPDKIKSSYAMMKKLKEISSYVNEADDFINMNWQEKNMKTFKEFNNEVNEDKAPNDKQYSTYIKDFGCAIK